MLPTTLNLCLGLTGSRSGEGALEEDLLGGLEGGREELREGGREDRDGPEMEEFRELCRDLHKQTS